MFDEGAGSSRPGDLLKNTLQNCPTEDGEAENLSIESCPPVVDMCPWGH